jgi:DNA-directed RNA polymerase subunit RPC12/RpoP
MAKRKAYRCKTCGTLVDASSQASSSDPAECARCELKRQTARLLSFGQDEEIKAVAEALGEIVDD